MSIFAAIGLLVTLVAVIFYFNERTVKVPLTIAVTVAAMLLSILTLLLGHMGFHAIDNYARALVSQVHFHSLLLDGLLGPLLFAGSFALDLQSIKKHAAEVGILALISTLCSAVLVTIITYFITRFLSMPMPLIWCFLFGALISPTDPVAVMATFKFYKTPASLTARIAGESLFNDGIGIVLFVSAFTLLNVQGHITAGHVLWLFIRESIFGLIYGGALGAVIGYLGAQTNQKEANLLLTLMAATGGFVFAQWLGLSGALAMVSCGMTARYYLNRSSISRPVLPTLKLLWEVIEDLLNAVLFLLIGFELLMIRVTPWWVVAMFVAIAVLLVIRLITVSPVLWWFHGRNKSSSANYRKVVALFTWGGLRGGLAVALALSLPDGPERSLILSLTYAIVAFAVVIQGFTLKPLVAYFSALK